MVKTTFHFFIFTTIKPWWLIGHLTSTVCWGAVPSGRGAVDAVAMARRRRRADLSVDEGVEAEIRAPSQLALAHGAVVALQQAVHGTWREEEDVAAVDVVTSSLKNANCTTEFLQILVWSRRSQHWWHDDDYGKEAVAGLPSVCDIQSETMTPYS